jgi:ribosomal RNA-processing protein 17
MAPQAKRRKTESATEEISFDPTARHDYLTGFHKRKQQRIKLAQEYAEQRAREEKREERKKVFASYPVYENLYTHYVSCRFASTGQQS